MCLGVPGRVCEWLERDPPFARALVEFEGLRREVAMDCVPEASVGEYVVVHAGLAISRLDAEEAESLLETLDHVARLERSADEPRPGGSS